MKKVLILGAGGMAGHVMSEYLAQKPEYVIIRCAKRAVTPDTILLDVTRFSHVEDVLGEQRPDIVINCVGLLIQASRDRLDQAILINSYLPNFLSKLGRKPEYGFRLIHISTDCVFSGDRGGYSEDDLRDGDTLYARTKSLGEVINERDLTLRTSIIGPELKQNGKGLLHWFLMQKGEIKGFTKAYWSGVTTLELAKCIDGCIRNSISGLINLTMGKKISKYELLLKCQKVWSRNEIIIRPTGEYKSDKSLISSRNNLQIKLPSSYTSMLIDLKKFMNQHRDWYKHYKF